MSTREYTASTVRAAPACIQEPVHAQARPNTNNFDAVRLFAALLVLLSHHFFLTGAAQPSPTGNTLGEVAVMIFFVISGYLVSESWYRDPHIVRFVLRRILRLWPALAAATIVIVIAGAGITALPLQEYWGDATRHFIVRNLQLRVVHYLPGVFAIHPDSPILAVNGSWWTIPLEMKCYLYLAFLGLIGLRRRWVSLLAFGVVALLYFKTLPSHPQGNAQGNLVYLYIAFFMTGVCARQFGHELLRFRMPWLGAGLVVLIAAIATEQYGVAEWVVIAPLTLVAGSLSTPWLRSAGRFGDLSYGIYLYAFFAQQLAVRLWPGPPTFMGSLLVSVAMAAMLAWCSWHAVEAPALRLKRHLRRWFPDQAP